MDTALLLSGVVGIGIAAQWLAWYLKQPSILFLLLIGIIVGPVLGVFDPDLVLGELMFPFISGISRCTDYHCDRGPIDLFTIRCRSIDCSTLRCVSLCDGSDSHYAAAA